MSGARITFSTQTRIDSWRGIAEFFQRDERTVQRWERDRCLPVHRTPAEHGTVFAYRSELLLWLHTPTAPRPARLGLKRISPEPPAGEGEQARNAPQIVSAQARVAIQPLRSSVGDKRGRWIFWAAALALALLLLSADSYHARLEAASRSESDSGQPDRRLAAASTSMRLAAAQPGGVSMERDSYRARESYLRGQFYWNRRTGASLAKALDSFTEAIVYDPIYAQAYAGLAATYELMPQYSAMPGAEAYPRAIAAARRAVALDPSSAEAHRVLAFALFYWDWNLSASLAEFHRAIELDPADAEAHHWYATALLTLRRSAEAKDEIHRARELNPGSRSILADEILIDSNAGTDPAVCLDRLRELQRAEPDFASPPRYIGEILLGNNDLGGWVKELKRTAASTRSPADFALARAAERGWKTGGERALFSELRGAEERRFKAGQTTGYDLALICFHLGDRPAAVHYLQAAFQAHDFRLVSLLKDPPGAALRGYAPYEDLRQQIESRMNSPA